MQWKQKKWKDTLEIRKESNDHEYELSTSQGRASAGGIGAHVVKTPSALKWPEVDGTFVFLSGS